MAEQEAPTPEDTAAFTALVDLIIEQAEAQGEALTRDEADTRAKNLLKNAADPNYRSIDQRVEELEARVATLEDVQGGTVVGPG